MVIRFGTFCTAAVLLIISGCTDLTEFDRTLQAGISIVSTSGLSVVHQIGNISEARSICVFPGGFLVATTEGLVHRYDMNSYKQTGSFPVGDPSPSGFFEMEYSAAESSVYLIGSLGRIIELGIPDMEIRDNFSVCPTPVDIEIATEKPYLYVAGANMCRIYEVRIETNGVSRSCTLPTGPTCMAIDQSQDSILVGTLAETELVSTVETGVMRQRTMRTFPRILAIETIPGDTNLCAVFEYPTAKIATIKHYFAPMGAPCWTGVVPIAGDTHHMCADESGSHVFVLSYLGNNMSRLVSYDCQSFLVDDQLELQGYPMDLEYGDGMLLVLTTE